MSDTPRTDKHQEQMEVEDLDVECSETYHLARDLERELNATKNQLACICKEGFDNQDTIGQEPADDYVLRKLAEMRKVIRQIYYDTETYADGAPDASAHDKLCNEISSKLEPYLK
jgi:hypothetical protein